jgi:DNA-binding transcriptional regulator YdaS (Cro superfamily)
MKLAEYLRTHRGAASRIARDLRVRHSTVLRWAQRRVPAERLHAVSRATGIPPAALRPDLAAAFDATTTMQQDAQPEGDQT